MQGSAIDNILNSRKSVETPATGETNDKFFSILVSDGAVEQFLELQFNTGLRSCFSYGELLWFVHDPDAGTIDMNFGGFMVCIKGRGLGGKLFDGLRRKRVASVKQADSEMQDHKDNETFIEVITVTPPDDENAEARTEAA